MGKREDLTGRSFSRLTVLSFSHIAYVGSTQQPRECWKCKCECGEILTVQSGNLRNGHTQSCGCLQRERTSKGTTHHGQARPNKRTPTYNSWRAMVARCTDTNNNRYGSYGDLGVLVCKQWQTFEGFVSSMGERPLGTTLGRLLDKGDYKPRNCRWMTSAEQSAERRKKRLRMEEE